MENDNNNNAHSFIHCYSAESHCHQIIEIQPQRKENKAGQLSSFGDDILQ